MLDPAATAFINHLLRGASWARDELRRFSGLMREAADRDAEPFTEIWHLEKPVSGRGGWLVAGIQQE